MQIDHLIPQTPAQWFGFALATILAGLSGWIARRKREPVELARITAETRQISVSTDVSLMQAATEALSKAIHMQDRCNLLECKIEDLERQVANAEDRAHTAEMFTEQLNMAAKLKGVNLSDFTPQQLKPPKP